ncbi:uncharacterized protein LOC132550493 [Ylistrum balloti]|uniref:uncharacterized protein LOC132550493 n=1 Tax=Ylistrum balloti TaxID=509963 RepID=UPI00290584CC|nr:uncharacterized protein LOC132550493 [Ylistrum balloti]
MHVVLTILVLLMDVTGYFQSDGRAIMVEPPHRSSLWRFRYPTHVNSEDDLLNCGGFDVQWLQNGGRCGVCGDPASGPQQHDDNGHYASGITVRSYNQGGSVNVTVEVLSNLLGYFEFRLCPRNSTSFKLTQECFEQNVLWIEESWSTRFYVGSRGGIYDLHVKLPSNIACSHCVFQWKYSTGYRMGGINRCECMGCGKQEQIYNCADVAITPNPGTATSQPFGFIPVKPSPTFLSSPENQSYIFRQRLREHLPVFPWPNGLLIPHNMMEPSSTLGRYDSSENGHRENGVHTGVINRMLLDELNNNTPLPDIKGIDLSRFLPGILPSINFTATFSPQQRGNFTETTSLNRVIQSKTRHLMKSTPSGVYMSSTTTPASPVLDFRKWNFTEYSAKSSQNDTSPTDKINNTGYTSGDSILYPLFTPTQKIPTLPPRNTTCDVMSPTFRCKGIGQHSDTPDIENWCLVNCRAGNCVKDICLCGCGTLHDPQRHFCHGVGVFASIPGMNTWCRTVCVKQRCPANICDVKTCLT